ncbi:hypothetical protein D3C85_1245790 [compost metagenome]
MDHIPQPDIAAVARERPVVGLMVGARLRLRHAEVHHGLAVVRVHAVGPVVDGLPGRRRPAEQRLDLRADIGERHGRPVDLPRYGLGGLQQRAVHGAVVLADHAPGRGQRLFVAQEGGLERVFGLVWLFGLAHGEGKGGGGSRGLCGESIKADSNWR